MSRADMVDLLQEYSSFLEKNEYLGYDMIAQIQYAIDEFVKGKAKAKKEKTVDPAFPEFVRIWVEAYPDLGFSPVDGKKIKSLIDKTKKYLVAGGKECTTEAALAMFQYVVNYLKRGDTWFAGKDLAVIDSKYLSLIFEIKNGKQRTSKAPSARDIINSL